MPAKRALADRRAREEAVRSGLTMADVQHTTMTAVGRMYVTETVEGRERYSVNVRYARELRDDTDAIGRSDRF